MVLRKEDILRGIKEPKLVNIKTLGGELPLRPLSKKEWADLASIEAEEIGVLETETRQEEPRKGFRSKKSDNSVTISRMDMKTQVIGDFKSKTEAIFLSINNSYQGCEEWSREEIQGLAGAAFDELFEAVENLSGVNNEGLQKEVDDFPED